MNSRETAAPHHDVLHQKQESFSHGVSTGKGTMHVVVCRIRLFRETLGRCIEQMCHMINVFKVVSAVPRNRQFLERIFTR
jgi:hypothetical protein